MSIQKVLIIGAGPAGLYCAKRLSEHFEVHLFEQQEQKGWLNGHPWADSIDWETLHLLDLPLPTKVNDRFYGAEVKRHADAEGLYEPLKKSHAPRITIDRNALTKRLFDRLADTKVHLHFGCLVTELIGRLDGTLHQQAVKGIVVETSGKSEQIMADLVIDAGGARSCLRRSFAGSLGEQADADDWFSAYKTMRRIDDPKVAESFVNGELLYHQKGYRWISLLDDDVIDIGCCIHAIEYDGRHAKAEVEKMIASLAGVSDECLGQGGAVIPMTLPLSTLVCNGYAAVGECAYMTNPGNGCGISGAIMGAELLCQTVMERQDASLAGLWAYSYEWFSGRGAYYATNYFPSTWFSQAECEWLVKAKMITGTLKNSCLFAQADAMIGLASPKFAELKQSNPLLWQKVNDLQQLTKRLYTLLLQYPQTFDEAAFDQWERAYRLVKQGYYRSSADAS